MNQYSFTRWQSQKNVAKISMCSVIIMAQVNRLLQAIRASALILLESFPSAPTAGLY